MWRIQLLIFASTAISLSLFFWWNYYSYYTFQEINSSSTYATTSSAICIEEPFDEWTRIYQLFILGASTGQVLGQLFRAFIALNSFTDSNLRHPYANTFSFCISFIHMAASYCNYSGLIC
jgi:hypothetical protein